MDIATMAHSLEGRSPFLSKDMLEFAPTLADDLKVRGKQTKYLLRRLAEKYLPSELINQPKRGFEVPLKQWVNYELKEIIFDYLGSSNTYSSTFIAPSYINDLITNKIGISEEKRAKQLYTLFALEVWHRKCYLNN
jgi:asparagine synthase (glutamine-hydrolysing)